MLLPLLTQPKKPTVHSMVRADPERALRCQLRHLHLTLECLGFKSRLHGSVLLVCTLEAAVPTPVTASLPSLRRPGFGPGSWHCLHEGQTSRWELFLCLSVYLCLPASQISKKRSQITAVFNTIFKSQGFPLLLPSHHTLLGFPLGCSSCCQRLLTVSFSKKSCKAAALSF